MLQTGYKRINSNFWNEIKHYEENIYDLQLSKLFRNIRRTVLNIRRTVLDYEFCHRYK